MERLVADGELDAVIDLTLAQLANTVCGGNNAPVPGKLKAAAERGIPMLVSVGGVDMISMPKPFNSLPEKFRGRKEYYHEENVLFVRSTPEENVEIAKTIAERLNAAKGTVKIILPETDKLLYDTIEASVNDVVEVIRDEHHINDPEFARRAASLMLEMINSEYTPLAEVSA